MIENINFELNTNIISGQGTLLKYFSSNSMKNIGVLVDKNLYQKSKYIKKCLKIVKAGKNIRSFMTINLNHPINI